MYFSVLSIIFGTKRRGKNLGASYPQYCERCQNQTVYALIKSRRWLRIFFIPVFPISRLEFFLSCEICGHSAKLQRKEVDDFKSLIDDTEAYAMGQISELEYEKRIREVEKSAFDIEHDTDINDFVERDDNPTRGFQ